MGRRALRKISPSLELSRYLKAMDDLSLPFVADQLFGRSAPLEIEIGSGKGLFLFSASAHRPEHSFLGIEMAHKYARFAAARLAKASRTNAILLHGDARRLFQEILPDACAVAVHVYFPDPWWKKRHQKRRVMNEDFMQHVERTLRQDGQLHFWTDVEEYFEKTIELISATTALTGPLAVPERAPEHDLDYRTHFERRMRLHNQPVYRAEFHKP